MTVYRRWTDNTMEDIFYKFKIYRILSTCIYWAVYNNGKNDTSLIFWQSFPVYSWYSSWLRDLIKFSQGAKREPLFLSIFYKSWTCKICPPLCCLFIFDIQTLITPLVFSNSSSKNSTDSDQLRHLFLS
jgi:hypothetical protein